MPDELGCRTEGCNLYNSKQSQQAINEALLTDPRAWNELPKKYQSILQSEGWTSSAYSQSEYANGGVTDVSWTFEDPFNIGYWSVVGLSRIRPAATALAEYFCLNDGDCTNETINIYNTANNKWPNGPQVINGLKYSYHALMRMLPEGLGGRGIPPSAVENAINNGYLEPSNVEGTVRAVYENVTIVWNYIDNVVVTVWKTGH